MPTRRPSEVKLNMWSQKIAAATCGTSFLSRLLGTNWSLPNHSLGYFFSPAGNVALTQVLDSTPGLRESEPLRWCGSCPGINASCPTGASNSYNKAMGISYRVPKTNMLAMRFMDSVKPKAWHPHQILKSYLWNLLVQMQFTNMASFVP